MYDFSSIPPPPRTRWIYLCRIHNQDRHLSTTNLDESGNNRNPKAQLLTD